jgi:AcrR family transcriptional regulator
MKRGVSEFKRGMILGAAARLFSERGYAATTIDAITAELSASKRAIYDHFAGKAEILVEICEQAVRFSVDLAERVARAPGDPATRLGVLARDFTTIVIENQDWIAISSRELKYLPEEAQRRAAFRRKRRLRSASSTASSRKPSSCRRFSTTPPSSPTPSRRARSRS